MSSWKGGAASSERLSVPGATIPHMGWTDAIDIGTELLPRRWKRWLAVVAFVGGFVLFPGVGEAALNWYTTEKAQDLVERIFPTLPSPTPVMPVHSVTSATP